MKNESNNKINVNQIGLRSFSFLQTKFQKLNSVKKDQSSFRKDNLNLYNSKNKKTINHYSLRDYHREDNDEEDNQSDRNNKEIFPNDSFGDSKRNNISDVIPIHINNNNKGTNKMYIPNPNKLDIFSLSLDSRIEYVLRCLDLVCLNEVFYTHNMNFNDMLFLSKEDYQELGLNMIQRNRLMKFCESFQLEEREYNYEEVINFFKKKKRYMIKPKDDNDYQPTACFANEQAASSSRYVSHYGQEEGKNIYNNEVFMPCQHHNHNNNHVINESPQSNKHSNCQYNHYQDKQMNINIPCKPQSTMNKNTNHLTIDDNHTIEHTELQYSSSMSNMSKWFLNKSSSSKRYISKSNIVSSYQKMAQEIDQYINNFSNKRKYHQTTSSNTNQMMTINSSKLQESVNRNCSNQRKQKNIYINFGGHIDTNGSQSKLQKSKPMKFKPTCNKNNNGLNHHVFNYKDNKLSKGQKSLNSTSNQPVNVSNCDSQKFTKSSSSVDLLSEFYKKKENLKSSLINCNNNINESRKLLKILDDN